MERIIPDWNTLDNLKQPLTTGERYLLQFLDSNLVKDNQFSYNHQIPKNQNLSNYKGWLIFVQPFLNGSRPDIVIFHPFIGCQIIEVKDWDLIHYSYEKDSLGKLDFYVSDKYGKYKIKSPVKQVEHYKDKLSGQLIPQLGEEFDKDKRKYGLLKTSIYFHNSSTSNSQKLFENLNLNHKVFPIFGRDLLSKTNLRLIVPDSYLPKSYYWNREWNEELLFWLNPPFHSLEQTVQLSLNKYQQRFAEPETGHHRVRGVAGSGKTQVLAYRAGKLASEGKRILILSFNITLWHYIRDMVQRSPFEFSWKSFTLGHFHGFCKDILNEFGEKWPTEAGDSDATFREIVPNKVLEVIKRGPYEKYDAIFIDEGQDYYVEWYSMLRHFLTDRDEVVVVCDKKQNIYGRNMDWLDKRRKGVEKFGDWIELKTVVRMPEGVAKITKKFSEEFNLNQDVRVESIQRPDLFNQYVEHTLWKNIDEENWLVSVVSAYETIKNNATSNHVSDTVILLPNKNYGIVCVKYFESEKNLKVNHVFENEEEKRYHRHKKAFWMGDSRLKMSTIHSFKGFEVLNVIMLIPSNYYGSAELFDKQVYVAMTRTRQNLIVLNANKRYLEFGKELSNEWD